MLKSALLCSLLVASACGDDLVIGDVQHDAGSEGMELGEEGGSLTEDQLLAQYAKDLAGEWTALLGGGPAVLVLTFTPSSTRPRSGTVTVRCECDDVGASRGNDFKTEYWLVKLDDERATMLVSGPLPSGWSDGLFVYDPRHARVESAFVTFTPRGGKSR
jgi:hypothetical protein